MEDGEDLGAGVVGVEFEVVADAVCGVEADHPAGGKALFGDELVEERLSVGEEFFSFDADDVVLEDVGVAAGELPGEEEGGPVDGAGEFV